MLQDVNFLSIPNNLSLSLWVDGVSLARSSNTNATPIKLQINELPPFAWSKHLILAGIVVGNHKPNISTVLFPIVEQLKYLHDTGLKSQLDGTPEILSKFIAIIFTAISVATSEVLRLKACTGFYSCLYCKIEGERVNGRTVFPHGRNEFCTHENMFNNMIYAALGESRNGVMRFRCLGNLPEFDLVFGCVHDDCHGHFEGCIKQLTKYFMGNSTTDWFIGAPQNITKIDAIVENIKFPTEISRQTRRIKNNY